MSAQGIQRKKPRKVRPHIKELSALAAMIEAVDALDCWEQKRVFDMLRVYYSGVMG